MASFLCCDEGRVRLFENDGFTAFGAVNFHGHSELRFFGGHNDCFAVVTTLTSTRVASFASTLTFRAVDFSGDSQRGLVSWKNNGLSTFACCTLLGHDDTSLWLMVGRTYIQSNTPFLVYCQVCAPGRSFDSYRICTAFGYFISYLIKYLKPLFKSSCE